MNSQTSLALTSILCLVCFGALIRTTLQKRNKNGKKKMTLWAVGTFALLGFLPLYFEPDLFGWITPFTTYYIFAAMPDAGWSTSQFFTWTGCLVLIQSLHLGISVASAARLTRKYANKRE
jgi:multisubunit Na+/H+ antiporter MnhB subunit